MSNIYSLDAYVDPHDGNLVKLFVNDRLNHRVLRFDAIPDATGTIANPVLGQVDFTSCLPNKTNTTTPTDKALAFRIHTVKRRSMIPHDALI